jgi:hypothetical protein
MWTRRILVMTVALTSLLLSVSAADVEPKPPGKLVDLGGHRLHVNCSGKGSPTVVVEAGLGDFSFDWVFVPQRVSQRTRMCTLRGSSYVRHSRDRRASG